MSRVEEVVCPVCRRRVRVLLRSNTIAEHWRVNPSPPPAGTRCQGSLRNAALLARVEVPRRRRGVCPACGREVSFTTAGEPYAHYCQAPATPTSGRGRGIRLDDDE